MTVVPGPGFGGPEIVQIVAEAVGWWIRDEHGILWIRKGSVHHEWHDAPVPMAEISEVEREVLDELEAGTMRPERTRITSALDARGMDGPEVDEALGVANALDTVVDSWEAGEAVPSAEELRRLAFLTGYTVSWFFGGPMPTLEGVFICRR